MNRPLVELALPLPALIASHDWWAALCAAATGHISCLGQPTLWYRRHGGNTSGPVNFWGASIPGGIPGPVLGKPAFAVSANR